MSAAPTSRSWPPGKRPRANSSPAPQMTPEQMVAGVKTLAGAWRYDAVSVGYPGAVLRNRPVAEPYNLGRGWVGFDFEAAFGCPAKVINDAAMQALGSYRGGKMLFLGLGTGLGTAMVFDGIVEPMELAHLPYRKATFEDYVGRARPRAARQEEMAAACRRGDRAPARRAPARRYRARRRQCGEGSRDLPPGCRRGDNANAFVGGFRLWAAKRTAQGHAGRRTRARRDQKRNARRRRENDGRRRRPLQRAGRGSSSLRTSGSSRDARCGSSSPPIRRAASG